jgi:hypothetical protein
VYNLNLNLNLNLKEEGRRRREERIGSMMMRGKKKELIFL